MSDIIGSIVGSRGLGSTFALLEIIANPAKAKAELDKLATALKALDAKEADLSAREEQHRQRKMEIARTGEATTRAATEWEARTQALATDRAALEEARLVYAQQVENSRADYEAKNADLSARERQLASDKAKHAVMVSDMERREKKLADRTALLDKREDDIAGHEAAIKDKRAKLAEMFA